jgi:Ca2+-binding EF-hand superfamily protein
MRKGTKIALAAGAIAILGAAGLSSTAIAEYRGSHGMGHHGMGHKGMMGMHGKGHKSMMGMHRKGHKGRGMARMMERFDANEDGKLTQEELDGARKKLLTAHDANKDGKLSLAEFEKLWLEVKRQRMVRGFQRIDRDGDASITLDEFIKPYAKMIERMDRNDDGVLDSEDRRHKRGKMGMHGSRGQGGGMGKQDGSGGMGKRGG